METIPSSTYQVGDVIKHWASHNRYIEIHILEVKWDPEAVMGSGSYVYTYNYFVYPSTTSQNPEEMGSNVVSAECVLPVNNRKDWPTEEG